jgi:hypothetical protein
MSAGLTAGKIRGHDIPMAEPGMVQNQILSEFGKGGFFREGGSAGYCGGPARPAK